MKEFYRFSSMGLLCLYLSVSSSYRAVAQTNTPRNISTGSNSNGFYEYLPAGYTTGSQTYPLLVFLQGQGEHGNGGSDLSRVLDNGTPHLISLGTFPASFTVDGQTFSYIVITPQFITTPSETDVDAVIEYALSNYRVDVHRVYLTGLSEGGAVTFAYAGFSSAFANKLAAIVVTCGAIGINDAQSHNIAAANLPVYATHNIDDPTVPYTFTIANIQAINSATPPPTILAYDTIFPNKGLGHNAWTQTYDPAFINPYIGNLNAYQWMLQYTRGVDIEPLPVTMTAYTAALAPDGTEVNIDWTTAIEENNKYFIIQRSGDGSTFRNLDSVPSAAPPGGGHSYVYTDVAPLTGNNFYRLEQVDVDGKATFYGILKVTVGGSGNQSLQVSPNPAVGLVYLHLAHPELGALQVSLSDMQGRLLKVWSFQKQNISWDQSIDLGGIAAGSYVLQVKGTTIRETRTIIKQ